jgi:pyruvate-ferredoxin/flavodoxin oxidoreductase
METRARPHDACMDGNEAAARVAYALSEVVAIYPITPASPMAELADTWAAAGKPNLWGDVPEVIEMQSEGGAAAVLHGALQRGALGTTFTASQGLLLMIPTMYKIAGELTPTVIHVAARTVATHALSIFGDHSDVMAARTTGFAMLCSSSVQEAHDLALVAHAATLESQVPFIHFFDGFRTSHELDRIELLADDDIAALIDPSWVLSHRGRSLSPDDPVLRGSAQNPDAFFQSREAANPWFLETPAAVQGAMDRLARRTGRQYRLVDYFGSPNAERILVVMGSAAGAAREAVERLWSEGEPVGLLTVRLFRPFPAEAVAATLPPTARRVAVLDRTKEPGAPGEPLYEDVVTALAESASVVPDVIVGRYGLSSKEFTPAMAKAVLDELRASEPRRHFTVGIDDDVTGTSLAVDASFRTEPMGTHVILYGLGSDGSVGAAKAAVKLVAERSGLFPQGYFVYDSKKAGSVTASHLRFSPQPVRSTYLVQEADLVACHQFSFLERIDVLERAKLGGRFLLNSPHPAVEVWSLLPREIQRQIITKRLDVYVIDATRLAREEGLGGRINTVMLPCLFALTDLLEPGEAIEGVEESIRHDYEKRGPEVIERNVRAARRALGALERVTVPATVYGLVTRKEPVPSDAPRFVQRTTAALIAGRGDELPVSAFPSDGTYPTGTARYEKRAIASEIPIWYPELCIDCGKCTIVCPHAAIRMKAFPPELKTRAPERFRAKEFRSRDNAGLLLSIQVSPDDCTGCRLCAEVCPVTSKDNPSHKALDMEPVEPHRSREQAAWEFFLTIPEIDRSLVAHDTVKGSQLLQPLFEFSGACAGCGETPYLKLLSQLFGDRLLVANATGCSSIFGGNLPTTPWTANAEGRGPAWSNSLFEDNAEFGFGLRVALDREEQAARRLLESLAGEVGTDLTDAILSSRQAAQKDELGITAQRERVAVLASRLRELVAGPRGDEVARLLALLDALTRKSVWLVGGDGWAYDIGFGGLDHVLASGRDVNVMVLDTEAYSNTGGQASKATPRGAVARFSASGKQRAKKDLGLLAMAYGDVYVAQVALGANEVQTVKALAEAEAWRGPSLVLAYASCVVAHGIDMSESMSHQKDAVRSGHWPLYRYHPGVTAHERPFRLDSHDPSIPLAEFALTEDRYAVLARRDPGRARHLLALAQADVDERLRLYRQLAGIERTMPHEQAQ